MRPRPILLRIDPADILPTFARRNVDAMIADACARSGGRFEAPHVRDYFERGLWQLWLSLDQGAVRALCATEIRRYPTGLQTLVIHIGTGQGLDFMADCMNELLAEAKANGCTKAEGEFRIGWRRALTGWTHTHDVLERDL